MTLAALVVTLASSASWAGFDATRKSLAGRVAVVPLAFTLVAAQFPLFITWAFLAADPMQIEQAYLVPGAVAVTLNILANLLLLKSLSLAPLSLSIPFLALTPALTALAGIPLLEEWPAPRQSVGIALVVAGALLLGRVGWGTAPLERAQTVRGGLLMMLVAALWAITGPVDKVALRFAPPAVHGSIQVGGVASMLLLLTLVRGQLRQLSGLRQRRALAALAVCFGAAGLGFQLLAIQLTLVSLVEALKRSIGLAGSVVSGRLIFGEPLTASKLTAVAVMGLGAALTLLG